MLMKEARSRALDGRPGARHLRDGEDTRRGSLASDTTEKARLSVTSLVTDYEFMDIDDLARRSDGRDERHRCSITSILTDDGDDFRHQFRHTQVGRLSGNSLADSQSHSGNQDDQECTLSGACEETRRTSITSVKRSSINSLMTEFNDDDAQGVSPHYSLPQAGYPWAAGAHMPPLPGSWPWPVMPGAPPGKWAQNLSPQQALDVQTSLLSDGHRGYSPPYAGGMLYRSAADAPYPSGCCCGSPLSTVPTAHLQPQWPGMPPYHGYAHEMDRFRSEERRGWSGDTRRFQQPTNRQPEHPKQPQARTTVMLRNLPIGYSRDMLTQMLNDNGFAATYDFVYMPMNFRTKATFGYAFVNFVSASLAERSKEAFEGFSNWGVITDKVCEVSWSDMHQGLAAHVERYRNSPVMHESVADEYKPAMFANGVRVVFAPPTKKIKMPRTRRTQDGSVGDDGDVNDLNDPGLDQHAWRL